MSRFDLGKLKKARVFLSILFFIPVSIIFLDPGNRIPPAVSDFITSLQLVPSILKITAYTGIGTIGLAIVLVLTLFFGRVYCSTLCPLGTFQDIVIRIRKKIDRRIKFEYRKPPYAYHYSVLLLTAASAAAGSMALLSLFEPFSNYGRMLAGLGEPVVTGINNVIAGFLGKFKIYSLYDIPVRNVGSDILLPAVVFLMLITYMAYAHGRLFCNSLCPAGALLGLVSRFSFFKISVDLNECNECGACEKVCKAYCIESGAKKIDFSACVACFNCIKSCPTDGIVFGFKPSKKYLPAVHQPSRRRFLKQIAPPAAALTLPAIAAPVVREDPSGYFANRRLPISPPGSLSVPHFTSLCTACHLCVSACPTQVLYPALIDYGIGGVLQPKMNYDASYCNYDCTVCGEICPSGAILPFDPAAKRLIQIGKAVFFRDDCVVVAQKKDCAACSEHCPTKAVYMVPYEGKLKIPELKNDLCVGCGACEHACPTVPAKAIYVRSNRFHMQSKKPAVQKQEKGFDGTGEFPF